MKDFSKLLSDKNVRVTGFRLQVLNVFQDATAAVDLTMIEQSLGDFDRITLYRTLKTFQEQGVLHEINVDGLKKYALCATDCGGDHHHHHDHVHFHCKQCGQTFCLEVDLPKFNLDVHSIDEIDIQIKGICKDCQ